MEQPMNLEFLSNLSEKQLKPIVESAIKTSGLEVVKKVLSLNKLNFKTDFVDVATKLNNKAVLDLLNEHEALIYNKFKDILLNKYQSLKPESFEAKQDLLLHDYHCDIRYKQSPDCIVYPNNNSLKSVVDRNTFKNYFNDYTNDIFQNMVWDNIVIAGGFVNNIVTCHNNNKSDINVFVYGMTDEIIKNKCDELFTYLKQYNPIFMMKNSLVHIIIPKMKYIIQIIPKIAKEPIDIINNFDFNYVKMYYDGKDVHTTIGGLIACKYSLATLDKITAKNLDDRIHKTIQKGYQIQYNPKFKKCSTIVTDHNINTKLFESQNMDVDHEKFSIVSKMLCTLEQSKHEGFVKLMFDKDSIIDVTMASFFINTTKKDECITNEEKECEKFYINDLMLHECGGLESQTNGFNTKYLINNKEIIPYVKIDLTPDMYTYTNLILNIKISDETKGLLNAFNNIAHSQYAHTPNVGNTICVDGNNTVVDSTISLRIQRTTDYGKLKFTLD